MTQFHSIQSIYTVLIITGAYETYVLLHKLFLFLQNNLSLYSTAQAMSLPIPFFLQMFKLKLICLRNLKPLREIKN